MVLERFRARGRGKTKVDLQQAERDLLARDIHAFRIAITIFLPGINWSSLNKKDKLDYYRRFRAYLEEFPSQLLAKDTRAVQIQDALMAKGLMPMHALEGCEYFITMLSSRSGEGRLKEVQVQKLIKSSVTPNPSPAPTPTPTPMPRPKKPGTCWLRINWAPGGAGRTNLDRGDHPYREGSIAHLVAEPSKNCEFLYWIINHNKVFYQDWKLVMDQDYDVIAVFKDNRPDKQKVDVDLTFKNTLDLSGKLNIFNKKGPGNVHGHVYHAHPKETKFIPMGSKGMGLSKIPIAGASVYIKGTTVATNASPAGHYAITGLPAGKYVLVAEADPIPDIAPNGYNPSEKIIEIKPDETEVCDFDLEPLPVWKPPKPEPGYHIVSSKRGSRFGRKRPHECPGCGETTLVEHVDERGNVYFKCDNPDCDQYDVRIPKEKLLGWKFGEGATLRESANKRLAWGKGKGELKEKYRKGKISKEKYKAGKEKLKKEIYGTCPVCRQSRLRQETDAAGNIVYKCTNPDCTNCKNNVAITPDQVKGQKWYKRSFVTSVGGPMAQISRHAGEEVRKGIFAASIIGIGAVISAIFGNIWFFFGFLSMGIYVLIPSPSFGKFEEGPMGWGHIMPWAQGGTHAGYAWMKSITKVSAIICFAMGFKSMGDVFNIFFVITCLVGYFLLSIGYDSDKPGQFIESLLRFGVLGCYFIPFYVFVSIFNSYVLGVIAFAFFAIPPMPNTSEQKNIVQVLAQGLSGQTAYYEMFDKLLFSGCMIFALIGSGSLGAIPILNLGWQLTGTLKYTFIYFWIIAAIGGFFSPAKERPYTGIIFLGGATIIYAVGPGSQDIGSALLGQWWPTVNEGVTAISEPIGKMFSQFGKTFGDAFTLLTCPTCYATQLMNGSYATNPVGETGPAGVELTAFEVSPVFIEQPFMITANIKNDGAYNAEGVAIALSVGAKAPELRTNLLPGISSQTGLPNWNPVPVPEWKGGDKAITISGVGIKSGCEQKMPWSDSAVDMNYICVHNYATSQSSTELKTSFIRQNVWQTVFSSEGLKCSITGSSGYELRKKSIPINVTLIYKYQTDSTLGKGTNKLEFISQAEWDRLARLDQLKSRLKNIDSESTSGPVKLPIGTPGLKSPILETQDFHLALSLTSQQVGGRIDSIESIVLNYPQEFKPLLDVCIPNSDSGWTVNKETAGKVVWTPDKTAKRGDTIFFCHFKALKGEGRDVLKGSPTKSFIVTAHANYTYANSQQKLVKVEFGSWCCTQESSGACASGYTCQAEDAASGKGICVYTGQAAGTTTTTTTTVTAEFTGVEDPTYSQQMIAHDGGKSLLGMGGASSPNQCLTENDVSLAISNPATYEKYVPKDYVSKGFEVTYKDSQGNVQYGPLTNNQDKICCYQGAPRDQCMAAYDEWEALMKAGMVATHPQEDLYSPLPHFNTFPDYYSLPKDPEAGKKVKQAFESAGKCSVQPGVIAGYISDAATATGLEPAIIKAIIMRESSFRQCNDQGYPLRSRTGCTGLMQLSQIAILDLKQKGIGTFDRGVANQNIMAGSQYFKQMLNIFTSTDPVHKYEISLAAYNKGPTYIYNSLGGLAGSWNSLKRSLDSGVQGYVSDIMVYYNCYKSNPSCNSKMDKNCNCLL